MFRWRLLLSSVACLVCALPAAATPVSRLHGRISDSSGLPLGGVLVRVFVAGVERARTHSLPDGAYDAVITVDAGGDPDVWVHWSPPGNSLEPDWLVWRESEGTRELEIFGPCMPRAQWGRDTTHDLTLRSRSELWNGLSKCLAEPDPLAPSGPQ